MTTKLGLYNNALRLCRERKLDSLSEQREPRRLLDDAYGDITTTGVVRECLETGQWTFATRTQALDYTPSVEPDFGYRRAFNIPTDWVRTVAVCSDEFFKQPLLEYVDERQYWYADLDTIYIKYVSDDVSYGADLATWTETFAKFVEAALAVNICGSLTGADREFVIKTYEQRKREALSRDAMSKPTAMLPSGSWVNARRMGWNRDRGSRHNLIG